jgi:hypothetical protein
MNCQARRFKKLFPDHMWQFEAKHFMRQKIYPSDLTESQL